MRSGNNKRGRNILAGLITVAAILFSWSELRWRPAPVSWPSTGSARLVSIEQLPDVADSCPAMPVSAIATLSTEFEESGLLADSRVYAATTMDITRPPVRTIRDTYPIYSSIAVDTVRDEVILTASGDAKPQRKITGGGGQVKVYPPKGLLIGSCSGGSICAWNLDETEDLTPHWRIPAQQLTGVGFSGLAIDPAHKEIILPSGGRNVIMTFSWPEVFD